MKRSTSQKRAVAPCQKKPKTGNGTDSASTSRSRALFVAVYNFKGGCAKTMITRELAATAVKAGKRVGMVDIDPQCNLTSWWLPSSDPYLGVGHDEARQGSDDDESEDGDESEDNSEDLEEQSGVPATVVPRVLQVSTLVASPGQKMWSGLCHVAQSFAMIHLYILASASNSQPYIAELLENTFQEFQLTSDRLTKF